MTISIKPTASGSTIEQDGSQVLSIESDRSVDIDSGTLHVDATNHNVGIGTTTPTNFGSNFKMLAVQGSDFGVIQGISSSGSTTVEMMGANGAGFVGTRTNHPLILRTNDTERMRIDSSGRVTMSYQPAFMAYNSGTIACNTLTDGQILVLNSTVYNRGNHYNTSTGLFTAPVNGEYLFCIYTRVDNIESTSNNYYHPAFKINGAVGYGGVVPRQIISSSASAPYESISESIILSLGANDTVGFSHGDSTISGGSGASASYVAQQTRFSGYLLG